MFLYSLFHLSVTYSMTGRSHFTSSAHVSSQEAAEWNINHLTFRKTGTKYHEHVALIWSDKIIFTGWAIEPQCPSSFLFWLSTPQHSLFSDSLCFDFAQLRIKREFWWPPSKCFLLSLINPGPHGMQVQASDVFNSCAHTGRGDTSSGLCMFLIWMYYGWHIHIDSWGELQEATTTF